MKKEEIEFNNGFVTALGLFYGHRMREVYNSNKFDYRLDGAKDHLIDIEYPNELDKKLKNKIEKFVDDVFSVTYKFHFTDDFKIADKFFDRCKELLKEIDEKCFKLKVVVNYE